MFDEIPPRSGPVDPLRISGDAVYLLRLYVTGLTFRSTRAIENIRAICEQYLPSQYELEIIDISQQPELAQSAQIIAAPTLIKRFPAPLRKLIGDLSDRERVLAGLNIVHHVS